ncbi:hypothetical protein Q3G72_004670 [Acer saccharum]|nr:hypothetical protein Q3G72_004670 [Acer saccharum]
MVWGWKRWLELIMEVAVEFFEMPVEEKLNSDDPAKTMRLSTSFNVNEEKLRSLVVVPLNKTYDDLNRHLQLTPLMKRPSSTFHLSKFLDYVLLGGPVIHQSTLKLKIEPQLLNKPFDDHFGLRQRRIKLSLRGGTLDLISWFSDDDYLLNRLIDLAEGVDVVSQMISPPTDVAAAGTVQRSLLLDTPHRIDIQEGNSNDEDVHGRRKSWIQKMDFEWIFPITNILLAIFTQLSSMQKPQYELFGVLLSYLALLTFIIELIYKDHRHRQIPIWRRRRGTWYYDRPQRGKSFATLNNMAALACALGQCVVTTINYGFHKSIIVTVLPIILPFGVLFSKILEYRREKHFNSVN